MNPMTIAVGYFHWHYGRAFRDIFVVWSNLAWFITHIFSIPLLLRTLFSPWKRMHEAYARTGLEDIFEKMMLNILSRFFGALMRMVIIMTGCAVLIVAACSIFVAYFFWMFAPAIVPLMFLSGIVMLFQ